jgi:hypothetical protein
MNKRLEYSSLIKKLISCESREQLSDTIKEINEFNKEYSITSRSEEFKKFEIVIGIMRVKLKRKHDIIENQLRGQKQNNKTSMKIIITERQYKLLEMDSSVRRRLKGVEFFLNKLMETMYPCDYDDEYSFMSGVISEAKTYFDDVDDFQGMDKSDFLETLETHFEDDIYDYYLERCSEDNQLTEGKNKPTNPELWSRAKAAAKSKYKVYPSAYANGFASKWYKKRGGGWRTVKKKSSNESIETNEASSPAQQAAIAINMKKKGIKPKNENVNEDLRNWFKEKWVDVSKKVDGKHPPCGRKDADGKAYPKCRPSKKVSSETPKVASSYDKDEKKAMTQQKRRAERKDPKVGTGNKPTMTSYKKK